MTRPRLTSLAALMLSLLFLVGAPAGAAPGDSSELKIRQVDKEGYPTISLSLGLTTIEEATGFVVREDGRKVKNLKVSSNVNKQPVDVTLIIDVSGSMAGKPLEDSKAAANLFIARARDQDRIAIVAFSSTVSRLADFTDDKKVLLEAIGGLTASGETAVYDALVESIRAAGQESDRRQNLILLSDGADTASAAQAGETAKLATAENINISVIALESGDFDPKPLEDIAARSGGRVLTAVSSDSLLELYDGLASELHNQYQLSYTSEAHGSAKIEVEATVGERRLSSSALVTGLPRAPQKVVEERVEQVNTLAQYSSPWLAAGLGFIAAFLAIVGLGGFFLPKTNTLSTQLKFYDQLRSREATGPEADSTYERAKDSLTTLANKTSERYNFTAYSKSKLERAGLPVKPDEYMVMHLLFVITVPLAGQILIGSALLTVLLIAFSAAGPLLLIEAFISKRRSAFDRQLPETLDFIASSMRAGYGLEQALQAAGSEAPDPTASELTKVGSQVQLGMPLEDALERMASRLGSPSFDWVVLAISIHRETGGNLAEIFSNLADSLRKRETVRRQIGALSAEGKLSAYILIILPFIEGFILFYVNPDYMSLLVTTTFGLLMFGFALFLMLIGSLWLKAIVKIEY